jgi:nucleoid-associated protein YgaU
MGLFDFVKEAGEKLFGGDDEAEKAQQKLEQVLADKETGKTLTRRIDAMGMNVEGVRVAFREGKATVTGTAASLADREKVVLMIGNTQGVAQVDDQMQVKASEPEPEATMYTVKSGDSLSKIAKTHYGDAMKYPVIFEANKPMLKDPNKIYPGQVLRIPPLDK